jgi:hypothetical protein
VIVLDAAVRNVAAIESAQQRAPGAIEDVIVDLVDRDRATPARHAHPEHKVAKRDAIALFVGTAGTARRFGVPRSAAARDGAKCREGRRSRWHADCCLSGEEE